MRILVFFDLPVLTSQNKRDYRIFRKYLVKNGFIMLQESVYAKLVINTSAANAVTENVKKNIPPDGLVQMMVVTEKQYSRMETLVGEAKGNIIDSDERLIVI